jgi:hypothetical protein
VAHGSSDGGAVLLKAADQRLRLIGTLAGCIVDRREPGKVIHETEELLGRRIYALACGYADCNDAARLSDDPIHKALIDRDPVEGYSSTNTLGNLLSGGPYLFSPSAPLTNANKDNGHKFKRGTNNKRDKKDVRSRSWDRLTLSTSPM